MAKKSWIERDKKKLKVVQKYEQLRKELKANGEYEKLCLLPRNASPVRLTNRCAVTGRSGGFLRRFGLSRLTFRELAWKGELPGVKKASW
jgi:small subunit ribosomal protein S14